MSHPKSHPAFAPRTPEDLLRLMEEHVPFNRLLGMRGESIAPGSCVLALPVRADFVGDPRRPALHGGVVSSLIDTAGGLAAWSALIPGESVSTVDLRVDYLEPAGLGEELRAQAELVRKGNRVCHVRIAVTQGGVLVAEGRGVYNIHRRPSE
ncbi:MAG TPA: hotdog fold thioesterase [Vicinamibacteria bacterium]|nr:hotdog fold thioesterase [Vicinamibacteria bacterium]